MSENSNPGPASTPSGAELEPGEKTGFAVYDNTLLRFSGPVRKAKKDADADKRNGPEGHDLEVREV